MRLEARESGRLTRPLGGVRERKTVEAWVKRVRQVGNEEETSEGASNDAVVASLGRSVGGHIRVGASESENVSDSESSTSRARVTTLSLRRSADTPAQG